VRVEEVEASLALLDDFCTRPGPLHAFGPDHTVAGVGSGSGVIEGWRGAIVHRIEVDGSGRLSRVKVVDPSFFNWPALSVALADTIVPDFPLANKSFNLSYAGNDL
jgi:Ni,Fe-hydrogenase III large subunit